MRQGVASKDDSSFEIEMTGNSATKGDSATQAYVQGIPPLLTHPFQKSNEIADFVGKIRSTYGSNKGGVKRGGIP